MTKVFTKDQIQKAVQPEEAIASIEEGFRLYADGKAVIAPISSLEIEDKGIAKIKYGYIKGQDTYVIKVGSFFSKDRQAVKASMQIYSQETGEFEALLLDDAYLTNVRTAAAGALVAKYFAPKEITKIGIIGTGVQAKIQLEYLQYVTNCKSVMVWGRDQQEVEQYKKDAEEKGFHVEVANSIDDLASECNVIILTTSASEPLLFANQVQQGTLVISVGADTKSKQEVDSELLAKADVVIADSIEQCRELGNIAHALHEGKISEEKIIALGDVVKDNIRKSSDSQIIVANLTGVAIQDIQIANLVYKKLEEK